VGDQVTQSALQDSQPGLLHDPNPVAGGAPSEEAVFHTPNPMSHFDDIPSQPLLFRCGTLTGLGSTDISVILRDGK
jgi:hypothetical protein